MQRKGCLMQMSINKYFRVLLFFILLSCNDPIATEYESCLLPGHEQASSDTEDEQRSCDIPEQNQAYKLNFNIQLVGFDEEQTEKMQDALERLNYAVNSLDFETMVKAHTYNEEETYVDNLGLTNSEIFEVIMEAAEELQPEVDHEIDLVVNLYYSNNSTVGYTYVNVNEIWINQKFFDLNSQAQIAGNILHEWTHKLGFEHDYYSTTSRNYSVPYGVGTIIEEIISNM